LLKLLAADLRKFVTNVEAWDQEGKGTEEEAKEFIE
jgi:hypothetical protein